MITTHENPLRSPDILLGFAFQMSVQEAKAVRLLGEVRRSPNDKRHYRQIVLPNGMRCLLISRVASGSKNAGGSVSENTESESAAVAVRS